MARIIDVITGSNLVGVVSDNIPTAFSATDVGVEEFIKAVADKLGKEKMTALRIWGHGATHYTDGTDFPKGNVIFGPNQIDADSIETFKPVLARLKPCFAQPGRAELRGCQAAKGSGKEMMKALAGIWNVDIYGSEKSQFLITWNPPVYVATPNGGFDKGRGIEVSEKR